MTVVWWWMPNAHKHTLPQARNYYRTYTTHTYTEQLADSMKWWKCYFFGFCCCFSSTGLIIHFIVVRLSVRFNTQTPASASFKSLLRVGHWQIDRTCLISLTSNYVGKFTEVCCVRNNRSNCVLPRMYVHVHCVQSVSVFVYVSAVNEKWIDQTCMS